MLNKSLKYALFYLEQGFSVIPVQPQRNKGPYLDDWKQYQQNLPEKKDLKKWWTEWPRAAVAIITGEISNIIVLEVNKNEKSKKFLKDNRLPITTSVIIGDQKTHYYYEYPESINEISSLEESKKLPGIKLIADDDYVLVPPAVDENRTKYKFHEAMNCKHLKLSEAPEWLLQIIKEHNIQNPQLLFNKNNSTETEVLKQETPESTDKDKEDSSNKENQDTEINKSNTNKNNKNKSIDDNKSNYNNKKDHNKEKDEVKEKLRDDKENKKDKDNVDEETNNTDKNNRKSKDTAKNKTDSKKHVLSRKNPLNNNHIVGINGRSSSESDSNQIAANLERKKDNTSKQKNTVSLKSNKSASKPKSENKSPDQYPNKSLTSDNTALKSEQTEQRILSRKNNVIRFSQNQNNSNQIPSEVESYPEHRQQKTPEETSAKPEEQKEKFYPAKIAEEVLALERENNKYWAYILETDQYYNYDNGVWQQQHKIYLFKTIRKILRKHNKEWEKSSYKDEVVNLLEEDFLLDPDNKEHFIKNNDHHPQLINFENGMFDWKNEDFKTHDPKYYSQIQFPVTYDSEADCPLWKKTLEEWVPHKDSRNFLQEFIGYCLLPDTSLKKSLILYGKGNNGKTTFLDTISHLIGENNLTRTEAAEFNGNFENKKIHDKLINISSKTTPEELNENKILKKIISGNQLKVDTDSESGIENYTFKPITKLIFSLNELPELKAKSDSWPDLFNIIVFPNQFSEDAANFDPYLKDKLIKELSGILNWALEGLKRIKERGYFTTSRAVKETELKYRLNSNNNNLDLLLKEIKNDRQQFRENLLKEVKNIISDKS